jgi:hypothetical protein
MVDKNEFDSKAAQLESKLNGYKTLILSSDEDEYKIVDSVSDVSVFVKIDKFRNELDVAIREFNEETRSINQAIVNMEVKDTIVLIDKFKTVDDTKLDLKSISDKNKYEIDEYIASGALVEHTLDKDGIIIYLDYISNIIKNVTPIIVNINLDEEISIEQKIKLDTLDVSETDKQFIMDEYKLYYEHIKDIILNIDVLSIYDSILDIIDSAIEKSVLF